MWLKKKERKKRKKEEKKKKRNQRRKWIYIYDNIERRHDFSYSINFHSKSSLDLNRTKRGEKERERKYVARITRLVSEISWRWKKKKKKRIILRHSRPSFCYFCMKTTIKKKDNIYTDEAERRPKEGKKETKKNRKGEYKNEEGMEGCSEACS